MNPSVTVDRAPSAAVSAALAGQGSRPRMQLCCPWCPALLNRGKAAVTHFLAQHPANFSRTPVLGGPFIATSFHSTEEDARKSLRTVAAQTGANYVPHGTKAFRCKCAPRGAQSALSSVDSCARSSVAAAAFSSPPVLSEHVTAANKRRRGICLGRASEVFEVSCLACAFVEPAPNAGDTRRVQLTICSVHSAHGCGEGGALTLLDAAPLRVGRRRGGSRSPCA